MLAWRAQNLTRKEVYLLRFPREFLQNASKILKFTIIQYPLLLFELESCSGYPVSDAENCQMVSATFLPVSHRYILMMMLWEMVPWKWTLHWVIWDLKWERICQPEEPSQFKLEKGRVYSYWQFMWRIQNTYLCSSTCGLLALLWYHFRGPQRPMVKNLERVPT